MTQKTIPARMMAAYDKKGRHQGMWLNYCQCNSKKLVLQTSTNTFTSRRQMEAFIRKLRKYGEFIG